MVRIKYKNYIFPFAIPHKVNYMNFLANYIRTDRKFTYYHLKIMTIKYYSNGNIYRDIYSSYVLINSCVFQNVISEKLFQKKFNVIIYNFHMAIWIIILRNIMGQSDEFKEKIVKLLYVLLELHKITSHKI